MVDPVIGHPSGVQEGDGNGSKEAPPAYGEHLPEPVQPQRSLQRQEAPNRNLSNVVLYNRFWRSSVIRRRNLERIVRLIWLFTTILEQLFILRFFLKLIAANPAAGFAEFIYTLSAVFLLPFFGLTGAPTAQGAVLETFTIIAMVAYALLAWSIVRALWIIFEEPEDL